MADASAKALARLIEILESARHRNTRTMTTTVTGTGTTTPRAKPSNPKKVPPVLSVAW
jgi:hypothetical protein